jgi:16S rRNA (cytosine967-C5)-methyltransferase
MNSRLIAARTLVSVIEKGQSLTASLENTLASVENPKDKAFIQAVCYGVCRYYHRLQFILQQLTDKPIKDTEIYALALVGLYQITSMRVKPHAAVCETVAATHKKTWAKPLINALLRRYLREQGVINTQADETAISKYSHPQWLLNQLQNDWLCVDTIVQANNAQPPMILRVNQQKTSRQAYLQMLADISIEAEAVALCESAIWLKQPVNVTSLPLFDAGWVSVQDTAAQLAANFLAPQAGQRVLDLCAAPAGKTAHLLEMQPQMECVAVDIDVERMKRSALNLSRLNLSAELIVGDATQPQDWWDGRLFERILVDAPCSGLGVIRRHPDIKVLRRETDLAQLQALQSSILETAWRMLAPEGVLLYATCSVLKRENESQIAHFLARHCDAQELPLLAVDSNYPNPAQHGWQILTGWQHCDGFYYAKLCKKA